MNNRTNGRGTRNSSNDVSGFGGRGGQGMQQSQHGRGSRRRGGRSGQHQGWGEQYGGSQYGGSQYGGHQFDGQFGGGQFGGGQYSGGQYDESNDEGDLRGFGAGYEGSRYGGIENEQYGSSSRMNEGRSYGDESGYGGNQPDYLRRDRWNDAQWGQDNSRTGQGQFRGGARPYGGSSGGQRNYGSLGSNLRGNEYDDESYGSSLYGRDNEPPYSYGRSMDSDLGGGSQQRRYPSGPKGYKRSDERIKEDVNDRLHMRYDLDSSDVEVNVQDGEVTLTGSVPQRDMKYSIEQMIDALPGIKDVTNQLKVKRQEMGSNGSNRSESSGSSGSSGSSYGSSSSLGSSGSSEEKSRKSSATR